MNWKVTIQQHITLWGYLNEQRNHLKNLNPTNQTPYLKEDFVQQ